MSEQPDWERLRAIAMRTSRQADPLHPVRGSSSSKDGPPVSPSGEAILRYFVDQGRDRVHAPAVAGVEFPYYCELADRWELEASQGKPRRVVALLLSCDLPQLPTCEQQHAIVQRYIEAHPLLRWDSWNDCAVQWLRPEISRPTITTLQSLKYVLYYAHHAQHVAVVSLTALSDRRDYAKLAMLAAGCGKTFAVLDAGIDTYRWPRQLPALAATHIGRTTSPLNAKLGTALVRCKRALGWRPNPDGTSSRPDPVYRQSALGLVGLIDSDLEEAKGWSEERTKKIVARFFPTENRCARPRQFAASIYLAQKLNWPSRLNRVMAAAIIKFGRLDVLAGDAFDVDRARELYAKLDRTIAESHMSLVHARSRRYASEVSKILREQYRPPVAAPWITAGLKDVPSDTVKLRELPPCLSPSDEYASAQKILRDLGATHLRDDEELVAGIASILCNASKIIAAEAASVPAVRRGRPNKKSVLSKNASSSIAPTATEPDCPTPTPAASPTAAS